MRSSTAEKQRSYFRSRKALSHETLVTAGFTPINGESGSLMVSGCISSSEFHPLFLRCIIRDQLVIIITQKCKIGFRAGCIACRTVLRSRPASSSASAAPVQNLALPSACEDSYPSKRVSGSGIVMN